MTPSAPPRLLAELAALGPYFAVDVHEPDAPLRGPWHDLRELFSSPRLLTERISQVRDGLARAAGEPAGVVELRVAASVAQLGLCARLMSPVLGAAVLGGTLHIEVAQARWVPSLGGPFRLSVPGTAVRGRSSLGAGGAAWQRLLDGPISQLARSVASMSVSPQVLWGNVASAVNGAAEMIAAARPDLAGTARAVAGTVLQFPALAGGYTGAPGPGFRRRNCCLIYRLSPSAPGYCGDCVLASPS
ncbi:MAG TPA: (2Fe-2S)-binding protein [Streptosporangiaceae bacterium]